MPMRSQFFGCPAEPLFGIYHSPGEGDIRRQLLIIPPFGEEVNKSRKMLSELARTLVNQGVASLIFDLYGCGDSAGELQDASWARWLADVDNAYQYLQQQSEAPVSVLGVRLGALLAREAQASGRLAGVDGWLLWQPVFNGKQFINQFLRLRIAASAMEAGKDKVTMAQLRQLMVDEGHIEVAGYCLNSGLVNAIETAVAEWQSEQSPLGDIGWLEVSSAQKQQLLPVSRQLIGQWQQRQLAVRAEVVPGAAFWQTQEISLVPALIERTCAWLTIAELSVQIDEVMSP